MIPKTSYRVAPGRGTSMGSIPTGLTTLSVSLIHGRFHAVAISRGTVTGSWDAPALVNEPGELATAVKQAANATGYSGSTVQMVLAHPRLVSILSAVPPAKGSSLERVLDRVVQRDKTFEGPAVWCHQVTPPGKTGPNALLHMFPTALLEQYSRACEKGAGLTLVRVVPASAVLHGQILGLQVPTNEAVMVVAGLGSTSILLVGQRDGQVLIARSVPSSWTGNVAGLLGDLTSTVLFAKEQFGSEVSGIYLFGSDAVLHQAALQAPFEIPVRPSLADDVPHYWATEALRLPPALVPNLVSKAQQKAPQRRAMIKIIAFVAVALVVAALGALGWSHQQLNRATIDLDGLKSQRMSLQTRHREFSQEYLDLLNKRAVEMIVVGERSDPLAAWSLGYLGEVLPQKLLLKAFSIEQEGAVWRARYEGVLLPTTNTVPELELATQVGAFTNRLSQAPMHMLVTKMELFNGAERLKGPDIPEIPEVYKPRLPANPGANGARQILGFEVEGLVR